MSKSLTFFGHFDEHGTFHLHREKDFKKSTAGWRGNTIVKFELGTKRDLAFSNYYFGAMGYLSDQTGYTKDELHEMNKQDFLSHPVNIVDKKTGEITERMVAGSTANLSTSEFAEFLERVRRGWAERGYPIPDQYGGLRHNDPLPSWT